MPKKKSHPQTKEIEFEEELHGTKISDPYRWLEQDSQETHKWIEKQNAYTRSFLDKIPERKNIKERLTQLFRIDTVGVPVPRKGRYFFCERKGGKGLEILYIQNGLNGEPRVLIDPNKLSEEKKTVLSGWYPSRDGKLLAYALSEAGNDQANIYVLDVATGEQLSDVIPAEIYPGFNTWSYDNEGFYYTRRHPDAPAGEKKLHQKIYYHQLGIDSSDDSMIFGNTLAKDDYPSISVSSDGRYLLVRVWIDSSQGEKTELYLYDFYDPEQGFISIVKHVDAGFYGWFYKDILYIATDHNAPRWKLMAVKIEDVAQGMRAWKSIIPEDEHALEYIKVGDSIFVETIENVHSVLRRYQLDGTLVSEIPLPTLGSLTEIIGEEDGDELFFGFTSFLFPRTVYRLDIKNEKIQVFKKVDTGIDTNSFQVNQIWYRSKDKTRIPMFVVHKKNLEFDGNNPVVLNGYGGFNLRNMPAFSKTVIPYIESGRIYAVANIRGGGEFGEKWFRAGLREKKQNVFDDFIAAAEWLIDKRYTNPERLAIYGWSNGGLLTGAAITQRPELFKAAIVDVPLLDMLRYHKFFRGSRWIPHYGDPDNSEDFRYLIAYSPYHNVKNEKNYPATLFIAAGKDKQVPPLHAYKMTAKLQQAQASENPILLRVDAQADHGGATSFYKFVEEYADIWSFIFWQLGINTQKKRSH
ncbi:prolyl oligopeptidase family serine peptidase [Patescibacteria group bacterium AH-259-L07]|nr:prolyl oligopeptidase family serine peptidase [Patescibacteria group bacterium AH-259-L07]